MNGLTPVVWTPGEVAERLRVTVGAVRHLRRSGRLRGTKVCGKWRYTPADVQAYVDACEVSRTLA